MNQTPPVAGSRPAPHSRAPEFPVMPRHGRPRRAWIRWSARRRPRSPVDLSAFQPSANEPRKPRPGWLHAAQRTARPDPPDAVLRPARRPGARRTPVCAGGGQQPRSSGAADHARAPGPWTATTAPDRARQHAQTPTWLGPPRRAPHPTGAPASTGRVLCAQGSASAPPRRTPPWPLSDATSRAPAQARPSTAYCRQGRAHSRGRAKTPGGHTLRTAHPARGRRARPAATTRITIRDRRPGRNRRRTELWISTDQPG
ncbi:MAG: hypothetical protein QOH84_401 [Kribbellaceae bacterium]|nr:hypothetical protein [Kribbellaceae bacterium]